ncbi:M20 metallopeptidase family protein [Yinghuangia sp. YIM S10712]|uniref:M20 metallopeptidase family protein n=1 Tax=Yinghuangia sp. YIM S10712 TaxID=3436930 RepID=UPI003F5351A3
MAETRGPIFRAAWERREEIREFRELLHRNPELAWQERETTERIGNALDSFGVDARVSNTGFGVVAEIGPSDGDVVLLRSDIDALKITEQGNARYKSEKQGVMHACGHDVTAAGLVHAAAILKRYDYEKGLPNKLRLVFQPAEEAGNGGAEAMVRRDGVLRNVKAAFGLHSWPEYYVGEYATREGLTQFSHLLMQGEIQGEQGHSARPEASSNLGLIGPTILVKMNEEFNGLHAGEDQPPILGWTGIEFVSGATNATPPNGSVQATVRSSTVEAHQDSREQLADMFNRKMDEYKLRGTLKLSLDIPPVINTPWAKQHVDRVLAAEVGRKAVKEFPGSTGGDDMAYYGTGVPGIEGAPELHYTQLGVVPRGKKLDGYPGLHTAKFDVHPHASMYAAVHYAALGVAGLSGHPGNRGPERQLERTK